MIKKLLKKFNCQSLLVLNGFIAHKKSLLALSLPIIAVDGAAEKLAIQGLKPDLIIGDLDSCPSELFPEVQRVRRADQNYSDFDKAVQFLEEQDLMPPIITGISGGHLDHILYNFILFQKSGGIFLTDEELGFLLRGSIKLSLPVGTKISIFGYPEGRATSRGLTWELHHYSLKFFEKNSPLNRTGQEEIELNIEEGQALVIIYMFPVIDAGLQNNS